MCVYLRYDAHKCLFCNGAACRFELITRPTCTVNRVSLARVQVGKPERPKARSDAGLFQFSAGYAYTGPTFGLGANEFIQRFTMVTRFVVKISHTTLLSTTKVTGTTASATPR